MRISDWSSDVCSSDLALLVEVERVEEGRIRRPARALADDEGRREGLERADQLHDEVEEDDRRQHGQGDADELPPRSRPVDGGRVVKVLRDLLQPGKEDHHGRSELPDGERDQGIERVARIGDPAGPVAAEEQEEAVDDAVIRAEEHKSELQSLMRIAYVVFCLKKKK